MRKLVLMLLAAFLTLGVEAQTYRFDFTPSKKAKEGYTKITPADRFTQASGYGYDFVASPDGKSNTPFFFSVAVPDGNYRVTAVVGNKRVAGMTTVRGESRRLFFENVATKKGETQTCVFVINKRNTHISDKEDVRIKPRERGKLLTRHAFPSAHNFKYFHSIVAFQFKIRLHKLSILKFIPFVK